MALGPSRRYESAMGEPDRSMHGESSRSEAASSKAMRAAEARDMLAWAAEVEARRRPAERPCIVEVPVTGVMSGLPGPSGSSGQTLRVKIVSARGLRAADWSITGGKSDPYCVCQVLGKPETKFQTAVIAKTLTPVWNHEELLRGYNAGDSISFSVYDKDIGKADDFLGKLTLTSAEFQAGFDGELPLSEAGKGVRAFLRLQIMPGPAGPGAGPWACPTCTLENPAEAEICQACEAPRPQAPPPLTRDNSFTPSQTPSLTPSLVPSLTPSTSRAPSRRPTEARRPLQVVIIGARGLRAADWNGKSDPYCICEVVGKPHAKLQTPHVDKTLEPTWNYAGELPDFSPGDTLAFTVYDRDWGKTDDLLGKLFLASEQFWPTGFQGELPLSECGRGIQAYLRVKVTPNAGAPAVAPVMEAWECPSCSLLNDSAAAACAACERPRPEPDGFQILLSRDTFAGRNAYEMSAADITRCKRVCKERGYGAFVVCRGMAYFRREPPAECLANLVESRDSTTYINTRDARDAKDVRAPPPVSRATTSDPRAFPQAASGSTLLVTIVRATGLRAADWSPFGGGKSDPYCVCEIPSKPHTKFKTPHIDKTLEPVWNHQALVKDFSNGDLLQFTVYDKDWGKSDDLLGRATLTSAQILPGGYEGTVQLSDAGKGKAAFLVVRVEPQGRPRAPSLISGSDNGRPLRVAMLSARGLRPPTDAGRSEAYCVCELPGRARSALRTPDVARASEPVWNFTGEMPDYAPGESLAFAVYLRGKGGARDELLGRATVPFAQLLAGSLDGELPLSDAGRGTQAFLRVRIELPTGAGQQLGTSALGEVVTVALEGARGLRHGSPYCVCEVPGRPGAMFRTMAMDRTPNPQWNHVSQVPGYMPGDSLVFTIYDAMKRDDVLGRLNLTSSQFYPTGFRGELPLSDAGKGMNAILKLAVEFASQSLPWPGQQASLGQALLLTIVGARGLRNAHWFSYSDSYCVVQIPGKPYSKVQTVVVKNSLDPTWNHEAEIDDYALGDALELSVWNLGITGDEPLGRATLTSAQLQRQLQSGGFDGEVPLLEGGAPAGFLRLRLARRDPAPGPPPPARRPRSPAGRTPDCSLAATALSVLSGVPVGLPSDTPARAPPAPPRAPRARPPVVGQDPRSDQAGMQVASVLDSLGAAYRNAGNLEEALVQSKKALELRVDAFGEGHLQTAASYCDLGSALRLQDRLDEAWNCYWRALQIRLQEHGDRHADTAASYTCLGAILLQQGDLENALQYYLRALDISVATLGEQHADTAACYNDVGAVFERKGDGKSALKYLLKALEAQRAAVGERHPALGDAHNNAGAVLWQEGRLDEALEHHRRAMEIRLQVLGDGHPDTALSYGNVGVILERLGRYPEAFEHQQRALEIRLAVLGEQHSETAASYINLGVVLERMLRFDKAVEHYKKAHSILLLALGARHAWSEQARQRTERCERSWRKMQKELKAE